MKIILNGQERELMRGITVARLLDEMKLRAGHVAVEVNLELVPRAQHARRELRDGDRLEVVTLVGGG